MIFVTMIKFRHRYVQILSFAYFQCTELENKTLGSITVPPDLFFSVVLILVLRLVDLTLEYILLKVYSGNYFPRSDWLASMMLL